MSLVVSAAGAVPVGELRDQTETVSGREYHLYVPLDYQAATSYPLVISSHGTYPGADNYGWDFDRWLGRPVKWGPAAGHMPETHDFIHVSMFFKSARGDSWEAEVADDTAILLRLIDQVDATYNIDRDAVLLTGFSGGGYPTHYIGNRNPDTFRALCGRKANFLKDNPTFINDTVAQGARHIPIYVFRGGTSDVCYEHVGDSYEWYTAKDYKSVKFDTFPTEGHAPDGSNRAAAWFIDLVRHNPVAKFRTYRGSSDNEVYFDPADSYDPDGTITAWSWEFGDDGTSADRNPIHSYAGPGIYRVFLTVEDGSGREGYAQRLVEVPQTNPRPTDTPTATPTAFKGDLDKDGDLDLFDVLRAVDIILGRPPPASPYESWAGDIDGDGDVDLFDVLAMIDILLGRP